MDSDKIKDGVSIVGEPTPKTYRISIRLRDANGVGKDHIVGFAEPAETEIEAISRLHKHLSLAVAELEKALKENYEG